MIKANIDSNRDRQRERERETGEIVLIEFLMCSLQKAKNFSQLVLIEMKTRVEQLANVDPEKSF